jgi:hypothetical protein
MCTSKNPGQTNIFDAQTYIHTPNNNSVDPSIADEWAHKDSPDDIKEDELCGTDGKHCPELPAFNGEDYFDDKPLGCVCVRVFVSVGLLCLSTCKDLFGCNGPLG